MGVFSNLGFAMSRMSRMSRMSSPRFSPLDNADEPDDSEDLGAFAEKRNEYHKPLRSLTVLRVISASTILLSTILIIHILFSGSTSITSRVFQQSSNPSNIRPHTLKTVSFSIKPVVYIFPQYYPFPENNKIWGENFTEWNNVNRTTHNAHGLETIRPHPSIGYYNGLDLSTRRRQGKLIRENGFYGLIYHHYWFSREPVMDHVLQAMLIDGEPNVPFMLSWANEPWIGTWEGQTKDSVFIGQDYGDLVDWRVHFDYLLPFFKHPNYIRSEGKVQFALYKPDDIDLRARGVKTKMSAAFRMWAIEEGLGGMDIIETVNDQSRANGLPQADAVNEFQPHAGGMNPEFHHLADRSFVNSVYHRGTMLCWDATPRHPGDGRAFPWPTCHPKSFESHLVRMMARIKGDPNPAGVENFLFINALNEWGEGGCVEPSIQFGHGYAEAMKNAIKISEEKHMWRYQETAKGLERIQKYRQNIEKNITMPRLDVCVIIRTNIHHYGISRFPLDNTIWSLQKQSNENWRAIIFDPENHFVDVVRQMDPRLKVRLVPPGMGKAEATDWIIQEIGKIDGVCGEARYLLVTDAGNEYGKDVFTNLPGKSNGKREKEVTKEEEEGIFLGLNVESRYTVWREGLKNDECCVRLKDPNMTLHAPSEPTPLAFDLTATLISFPKYLSVLHQTVTGDIKYNLSSHPATPQAREGYTLITALLSLPTWRFLPSGPATSTNKVRNNPSYSGCKEAGAIWVDAPEFSQTGCYSTPEAAIRFNAGTGDVSRLNWQGADLAYYRKEGLCLRDRVPEVQGKDGGVGKGNEAY